MPIARRTSSPQHSFHGACMECLPLSGTTDPIAKGVADLYGSQCVGRHVPPPSPHRPLSPSLTTMVANMLSLHLSGVSFFFTSLWAAAAGGGSLPPLMLPLHMHNIHTHELTFAHALQLARLLYGQQLCVHLLQTALTLCYLDSTVTVLTLSLLPVCVELSSFLARLPSVP